MISLFRLLLPGTLLLALIPSHRAWCALAAPITYSASEIDQTWSWAGSTRGLIMHDGVEVLQAVTSGFEVGFSYFQTGYIEYVATFRLKLFSGGVNDYDAGFCLSGFLQPNGQPLSRNHSIYIIPGKIGLLSTTEQFVTVPGPAASLYSFEFVDVSMAIRRLEAGAGNELAVYVNQPIESILSRASAPLFSRNVTDKSPNGVIAFGDNSGDTNSYYMMESVMVQGITVPEPANACLLMLGGIVTLARRRDRERSRAE